MIQQKVFRGTPIKLTLESAPCFYFCPPEFEEKDIEQKLTISSSGRVTFTSKNPVHILGTDKDKSASAPLPYSYSHTTGRWMKTMLQKEFAEQFLNKIIEPFRNCLPELWATDCGSWKLTAYNEGNEKFVWEGCLVRDCFPEAEELSYYIRKTFRMPSLCVFDGGSGIEKYIYVSVVFEENKKSYYYTTDDETISIGDKVLVPFGKNELEGEVVEIEICSECDVPFPLWKTKAIIKVMQKAPCEVHKGKESEE